MIGLRHIASRPRLVLAAPPVIAPLRAIAGVVLPFVLVAGFLLLPVAIGLAVRVAVFVL